MTAVFFSSGTANAGEVAELKAMVKELTNRVNELEGRLKESEKLKKPIPLQKEAIVSDPDSLTAPPDDMLVAFNKDQKVTSGNEHIKLELSGHVNRAALSINNGENTRLIHVDNDNHSTRFRLAGEGKMNEIVTGGAMIELGVHSNWSATADIDIPNPDDEFDIRVADIWFEIKDFGKFWIGKGWTASEDTLEVDLSGTTAWAFGAGVGFLAEGARFRDPTPKTMGEAPLIGPTVFDSIGDLDGLARGDRIRYDTPVFKGFTIGVDHVSGDSEDIAIRWAGESKGGHKLEAAAAAAHKHREFNQFNTSASVLFSCGISVGAGFASQQIRSQDNNDEQRLDPQLAHGKLGYIAKWFEWGDTAFSVDYTHTKHIAQNGDKGTTYSIALVQNLDKLATELYAGVRWHELHRSGFSFNTITAAAFGARMRL